ncbi:MAG: DUF3301 domain-containing protein [Gammaproteobacteria bacterium]|nr:DUF3301 domain-containing protein [Gammaproteobacteria bacterium]
MYSTDFFIILFIAAVIWYWLDGMKAKEIARQTGKDACKEASVEFLDDTVAVSKVRLKRNTMGQMSLYREYQFEFTSDGEFRYHGEITMLGKRILNVNMDAYRLF